MVMHEFNETAFHLRREWLERLSWLRCLLVTHDEGDLVYDGPDQPSWEECLEGVRELYMIAANMCGVPPGMDPFELSRAEEAAFERRREHDRRERNETSN
jgi:hypothetical protein